MKHLFATFTLIAVVATAGCAADETDTIALTLQSCYDTGFGLKCVPTPDGIQLQATDVNADGLDDVFVCGDAASASDSDSTADDSDESIDDDSGTDVDEDEDGDADSESDSDSDSDSDEDCGPSIEEDGESSTSDSDADGDGDGDTVPDVNDCDCV